jgi:hypothetical protein
VQTGITFFFHNSFLAVTAEGGIISAVVIVALLMTTLFGMISLPPMLRNPWFEMSLISILAIAFHLGEVLLDLPAAVAIGFCLHWIAKPEPDSASITRPTSRMMRPNTPMNWPKVTPVP